ncbi:MAG: hypothetical protein GF364_14490 [Candidatus Lokiarchaeota archaeon]|nr:hypothetical protein [Candidatus Lokiarchaeota archaeon]
MSEDKENNKNKGKFTFQSWDEIVKRNRESWQDFQEQSKKNWNKFLDGINEFFGIPPRKNIQLINSEEQLLIGDSTTEKPKKPVSLEEKPPEFQDIAELTPQAGEKTLVEQWEEDWNEFGENILHGLGDLRIKMMSWNQENAEWLQDQMLNNEASMKIWLKKQEIKRKNNKEKRKLALKRFNKWVEENHQRVQRYFENQKEEWENQIQTWKEEQEKLRKENKEKWLANQEKFKEDYKSWIENRRERAMEKAKYRMRVGWRQSLYVIVGLLPVIIVVILILALVNAFT